MKKVLIIMIVVILAWLVFKNWQNIPIILNYITSAGLWALVITLIINWFREKSVNDTLKEQLIDELKEAIKAINDNLERIEKYKQNRKHWIHYFIKTKIFDSIMSANKLHIFPKKVVKNLVDLYSSDFENVNLFANKEHYVSLMEERAKSNFITDTQKIAKNKIITLLDLLGYQINEEDINAGGKTISEERKLIENDRV